MARRAKDRPAADTPTAALGDGRDHLRQPQAWLTVADVAALINVTVRTVRSWTTSGYLPASKVGRRVRVSPEDLRAFMERHRIHKPPTKP